MASESVALYTMEYYMGGKKNEALTFAENGNIVFRDTTKGQTNTCSRLYADPRY